MLGEIVKKRMSELGISQAELARRSGLSTGHIADIVSGKRGKEASWPTLQALACGLGVQGGYFFEHKNSDMRSKVESISTVSRVRSHRRVGLE